MKKFTLNNLAKQLNISRYDIDNILKSTNNNLGTSAINSDLYKGGTHYGTISIKDFIMLL